jgi:hypothetical protein
MAKKSIQAPPAPPKRGRPRSANPKERKPVAVTLRAGEDWIKWLDGLCETLARESGFHRPDRTEAIDLALSRLAAAHGIEAAPPRY